MSTVGGETAPLGRKRERVIDTSTEAAAQRSERGSGRPKSLAVAIGVGSLVLGGADAVALVTGHLARGRVSLLLRAITGVMGLVALVVAVVLITRRAIFAVSSRR